ncbi:unnamed protein product [Adineta steineri]|uniref:Uncharacterized protein n=1 Tax=Adineta steineri TaxID=433720 RepID=A0A813QRI9_9BILA|nr:unnamed protein product [Adineta steineri]CAF1160630.1 unnamed protein product [Adineta steineri]
MYSKFSGYFRPSRSHRVQASMYKNGYVSADDANAYYSAGNMNDPLLRFIIIRHGERVDNSFGPGWTQRAFNYGQYYPFDGNMPPTLPVRLNYLDYEGDTPLTRNGLKQSWNVGNTLAKTNSPVVACYSSPAIRSIQTADNILAGMGRRDIPIKLDLSLFECSSWYARSPINFMSDQELLHNGLNIDHSYQAQVKNLQPTETEYQYYDRSKEIMKKLIKVHRKTGGTVLIVAHAPSLEVLTRHLMNGHPRPEQLYDLAGRVNYCSMTILDGKPSSKAWQFRYSLDELSSPQQQTADHSNGGLQPSPTVNYQPLILAPNFLPGSLLPTPTMQTPMMQPSMMQAQIMPTPMMQPSMMQAPMMPVQMMPAPMLPNFQYYS